MTTPPAIPPDQVLPTLRQHVLIDGLGIVIDLEKSSGAYLVDAVTGRKFIDLYSFYGSMPVGFNHPWFDQPEIQADLLRAARFKVANSDIASVPYAHFVQTLHRVMPCPTLERYFFIEGGALAVENALKAAMDWKVRKNLEAGRGERGTGIVHFERAFHGRGGYTLSLTNTDPRKTQYFATFNWPRIPAPALDFTLPPRHRNAEVQSRETQSLAQIKALLQEKAIDLAAIIIEPIQSEGGDNHFRGEFLRGLRQLCDEHDLLLIFDEVQTGMGMTGRNWCCQYFDVLPDLLVFGKKSQVCGVMAGPRLDLVCDNVFRLPSRINSTWGGNLVDMVRATHYLNLIERHRLVENARNSGQTFLHALEQWAAAEPLISSPRGRGLILAFDLPNRDFREAFYHGLVELGILAIRCGDRSIRFRPVLDFPETLIPVVMDRLRELCQRLNRHPALRPAA